MSPVSITRRLRHMAQILLLIIRKLLKKNIIHIGLAKLANIHNTHKK